MDLESIFFTLCLIWYFSNYGQPYNLFLFLRRLYKEINDSLNSMKHLNTVMTSEIFANESEKDAEKREEIKYEDKFLKEFRDMNKELTLKESEQELKALKTQEYFKEINDSYMNKIEEIKFKIHENTNKLTKYEGSDDDYCIYDGKDEDAYLGETKELRIQTLLDENNNLNAELDVLKQNIDTTNCLDEISKQVEEKVNAFMFDHRLEKLKNCFVMEYTPLGNVLMFYDKERESFKFYSDNTIPYRYLEVVGRKYAKHFGCKQIFVDMEDELKLAEEKWEKERIEKETKGELERIKKEEAIKNNKPIEQKKNVFAKFKSYNKEAGTGHVNTAPPPKNSIPNKLTAKQEKEKVLLKEKANRYTYEGKIANFNFIKKIDRKVVDKKYAMSFADFKKNFLTM